MHYQGEYLFLILMDMEITKVIRGDDLMVYDASGKSLAFATNHSLNLSMDVNELSTKDSSTFKTSTPNKVGWEIQSENLYTDTDYNKLFEAMVFRKPIKLYFGLNINTEQVEDSGISRWTYGDLQENDLMMDNASAGNFLRIYGTTSSCKLTNITVKMGQASYDKDVYMIIYQIKDGNNVYKATSTNTINTRSGDGYLATFEFDDITISGDFFFELSTTRVWTENGNVQMRVYASRTATTGFSVKATNNYVYSWTPSIIINGYDYSPETEMIQTNYKGKAIITSLTLNAGTGDNATYSVTFTGVDRIIQDYYNTMPTSQRPYYDIFDISE